MGESHAGKTVLFVSPQATSSGADGTAQRPFSDLPTALTAVQIRSQRSSGPIGGNVDIICIERPGAPTEPERQSKYRYFIDEYHTGNEPDGSEDSPWKDFRSAVEALTDRSRAGELTLQPGDHLAILRHQVFTPTTLERRKINVERVARTIFMLMALVLVLPVLAILGYVTVKAWPSVSPAFLLENPREMGRVGGIWAPLVGTFMLVLVSLVLAAPVGVLAGVYLNEYAPDNWATRLVNLAVVNLAGVPSIVHGLFGFGAFVGTFEFFTSKYAGYLPFDAFGKSLLAASCTLAVMTMPVIITSTREALASVPRTFREACWNMGATRWQTIRTVVLPNSVSGILTGVILQVSRVAGETAPILFTGAATFLPVPDSGVGAYLPFGLTDKFMALSMHLYTVRTQITDVSESMQFATAFVLIGLVILVNSTSIAIRVYLRSRKKW